MRQVILDREPLERLTARRLEALSRDLEGRVSTDTVVAVGRGHFERLLDRARFGDFIPLLVYRFTKEDLLAAEIVRLEHAA